MISRVRCAMQSAVLAAIVVTGLQVAGADEKSPAKLAEGWFVKVPLSEASADGKQAEFEAWLQDGWLLAERRSAEGETEWMVVLAEASDPQPPEITANAEMGTLRLSYREGRYFIRDEFGTFRCLRQRKTPELDWPRLELPPPEANDRQGGAGREPNLSARLWNSWFTVVARPLTNSIDCVVRLVPKDLHEGGNGFQANIAGVNHANFGEQSVMDDGDLLVAERMASSMASFELAARARRAKIIGNEAPEIVGTRWLNSEQPLTGDDFEDKAVLVAFWSMQNGSSIQQLGRLEQLFQKYGNAGLVVVGVHHPGVAETFDDFVAQHGLHFPIVIDDGKTDEAFGNPGNPTYFLVGRDGKVAWGFAHSPPTDEQIEKLLQAGQP